MEGPSPLRRCFVIDLQHCDWVPNGTDAGHHSDTEIRGSLRMRRQHYGLHPRSIVFESEAGEPFRVLNLGSALNNVVWATVVEPGMQAAELPFAILATATPLHGYGGANRCVVLRQFELWVNPGLWASFSDRLGSAPCEAALCKAVCNNAPRIRLDGLRCSGGGGGGPEVGGPEVGGPEVGPAAVALPLLPHQVRGVRWMRTVEGRLRARRVELRSDPTVPLPHVQQRVNLITRQMVTGASSPYDALVLHPHGYVLAEAPGRGKTCMVIEMAARDRLVPDPPPCGPDEALHSFRAPGTLVVMPNHLCVQWGEELRKFAPSLRCLQLFNARDARRTSVRDLLAADVVLTTFGYLTSLRYAKVHAAAVQRYGAHACTVGGMVRGAALRERVEPGAMLDQTDPVLALPHWRRVCVDELHQVTQEHVPGTRAHPLTTLHADVWVGVTGTPSLRNVADIMQMQHVLMPPTLPEAWKAVLWTPQFCRQLAAELVWRPEGGAADAGAGAAVSHLLHPVHITRAEQDLLAAHSHRDMATLVQVASYFNVLDVGGDDQPVRTMDEVVRHVRREFAAQHAAMQADIAQKGAAEQTLLAELAALESLPEPDESALVLLRVKRGQLARVRAAAEQERQGAVDHERSMRYFEGAADGQRSDTQECPICYDQACDTILRCGHTFCGGCISQALRHKAECPVCKTVTVGRHVHRVVREEECPSATQQRYGTKLAAVAAEIRRILDAGERPVAFVQWAPLMRSLAGMLGEAGVSCAVADGNTNRRTAAVRRFDARGVDVLLLTTEACSGLNLVSASHVLWVHAPVGPDYDATKATVQQSVARCARLGQSAGRVRVHWFVTQATAEQTVFEKFMGRYGHETGEVLELAAGGQGGREEARPPEALS